MAESWERPTAAFILVLIAGIWILAMAVSWWGWGPPPGASPGMMGGGWMRGRGALALGGPWTAWLAVTTGVVLVAGAIGMYARPRTATAWGVVVIVAAAVNLFIGLGGFLASILGIVGGALAAVWRPTGPSGS